MAPVNTGGLLDDFICRIGVPRNNKENVPKLAIIDQTVSAGGVERFLHGLIAGAIEERITDDWEIVLVRNRLNSARIHVPWPQHLLAPKLHVRYMDGENPLSRALNQLAIAGRILGIPGTGALQRKFANVVRSIGPARWRAYCGETRCWLEDYFQKNSFDIVYFSYPYFLDPPRLKVPMVATPHDFTFKHGLSMSAAVQRLLDTQMPKWLESCSQVVVSSQFIADDLKRFYPAWATKAHIIRLGIPSAAREPSAEEVEAFRKRNGLPERFLLVVGWIVEHKNQQVVFEAVAKLRERGLHIPVVCVGPNSNILNGSDTQKNRRKRSSSYVERILKFCESVGLRNGSDYFSLGFVDDLEVDCLYRSAMMLIVPTITEAGSFPAREAMRAGCPVAFSHVPVFEEELQLVEGNAWTFPTHDSGALANLIVEIAGNRGEARRRAAAAREIVSRLFSWRNTARAYFSLFEQLASLRSAVPDNPVALTGNYGSSPQRPSLPKE
jgi:glycosyltransferase involved in cell wall biosynthesis